jgi:hypothetical protein
MLLVGFFLGSSNIEFKVLLTEHETFFSVLAVAILGNAVLDGMLAYQKIKKARRKAKNTSELMTKFKEAKFSQTDL